MIAFMQVCFALSGRSPGVPLFGKNWGGGERGKGERGRWGVRGIGRDGKEEGKGEGGTLG